MFTITYSINLKQLLVNMILPVALKETLINRRNIGNRNHIYSQAYWFCRDQLHLTNMHRYDDKPLILSFNSPKLLNNFDIELIKSQLLTELPKRILKEEHELNS